MNLERFMTVFNLKNYGKSNTAFSLICVGYTKHGGLLKIKRAQSVYKINLLSL
jgi:hypothetical protein